MVVRAALGGQKRVLTPSSSVSVAVAILGTLR